MDLKLLTDDEKTISILANWYFDEWGDSLFGDSLDTVKVKLNNYVKPNQLPLIVIAFEGNKIIGASQLKFHEMDIYPEKEHWLGGVFVDRQYRGNGVAKTIIAEVISLAKVFNISKIYLQTEFLDGGLYSRLGWKPIEKVNYQGSDVLVMERDIAV